MFSDVCILCIPHTIHTIKQYEKFLRGQMRMIDRAWKKRYVSDETDTPEWNYYERLTDMYMMLIIKKSPNCHKW